MTTKIAINKYTIANVIINKFLLSTCEILQSTIPSGYIIIKQSMNLLLHVAVLGNLICLLGTNEAM